MDKIRIIKTPDKEKPYLVIYKPKGLPSAPLSPDDTNNALYQAILLYPEIKNVTGKKQIEYGLLHRLDTPTDGLLLISTNQNFYDYMINLQSNEGFIKYYTAFCNYNPQNAENLGFFPPFNKTDFIQSYFRSFGEGKKEVRPVTDESGMAALKKLGKKKLYTTQMKVLEEIGENRIVECKISQGFRHQVRCHLAWAGYPVQGDDLYNSDKKNAEKQLCFSATKIEFEYPIGDLNSYEITFTWT